MPTSSTETTAADDRTSSQSRANRRPGAEFLAALRQVRRPVIVGHVTPDADCLGSMFGLAAAMRAKGIDASVGLPADCVANKLKFMVDLAGDAPQVTAWDSAGPQDSLIVVDTAAAKRINLRPPSLETGGRPSFNIDHHITNDDFAGQNWVDPHASSCSEMIAVLIDALGWKPSPQTASLLYAGIHGDTAGFSLATTSADALHIAAELVRAGADVGHIGEQLCRSQGKNDFELLRRVYDHTKVVDGGRIAYSHLSYQDLVESGCKADDIDDQVSIPRALKGVCLAILFSEGEPGVIRINLRGEGNVTVVELARRFGGGGHAQSAGVKIKGQSMERVMSEVVAAAEEHLQALGAGGRTE